MSHVFPRQMTAPLPQAVRAEGCYIIDAQGKRYFDGSGGAAVSCLGHGDPEVVRAIQDQVANLAFAHTGFFTSAPAEALADLLCAHAPDDLDRVYFVSGGCGGVEAALKLARQYHLERGAPQRRHVIARRQSYHGNTLGALAAGGNQLRRAQFEPLLMEVSHIAPCYAYADKPEDEPLDAYGLRVAQELEAEIERLDPDTVMAFLMEPVVGAKLFSPDAVTSSSYYLLVEIEQAFLVAGRDVPPRVTRLIRKFQKEGRRDRTLKREFAATILPAAVEHGREVDAIPTVHVPFSRA